MSRWILYGLLSVAASIIVLAIAVFIEMGEGDPFDKFAVAKVVTNPAGNHAVIYRYYHANSSGEALAVSLIRGSAPGVGTNNRPKGEPILVWFGRIEALDIAWNAQQKRFSAAVMNAKDPRKEKFPTTCFSSASSNVKRALPSSRSKIS